MPKPRLLFYCQHLLGLGHLTRSLALCKELVEDFEVDFLHGGPDSGLTIDDPSFRLVALPPLLMREGTNELYDPTLEQVEKQNDKQIVATVLFERQRQIRELIQTREPKIVITELFPFGRNKLKNEILNLISTARARRSDVHVFCSLKDILVQRPDQTVRDAKIANLVNTQYDLVLVHADKAVVTLDETYTLAGLIRDKISYTGFITEPGYEITSTPRQRPKKILVSQGGGAVGGELLQAVARTVRHFPNYHFTFALGPYAKEELKGQLTTELKRAPAGNWTVAPFIRDFEGELANSALSISLAGYNTVMNVLHTRTAALVYPYRANKEQIIRAEKLEALGFMKTLRSEDLFEAVLRQKIEDGLLRPYPAARVDLRGAKRTRELILDFMENWLEDRENE